MPSESLKRELAELHFPLDNDTRAAIQRCVREYVDSVKAEQWPPERVVIGLKRVADDAGIHAGALSLAGRTYRDHLLMDIVAWGIDQYYHGQRGS